MTPAEISALRKRAGLTQYQLADVLGVSQTLISQWESGDRVPDDLRLALLGRIADQLEHEEEIEKWRGRLLHVVGFGITAVLVQLFRGADYDEDPDD